MPLTTVEYQQFLQTVHQIRDVYDQMKVELEKVGNESGEMKQQADRLEQKIQLLEAEKNKPPVVSQNHDAEHEQKQQKKNAFLKALRYGYDRLPAEEKALVPKANTVEAPPVDTKTFPAGALVSAEDTAGGLFAPPEFVSEIVKGQVLFSQVRTVARVRTTSNRSIQMPKRTGVFSASWVGEKTERSVTSGYALGRIEIPTHEMYALVLVSEQDLEDIEFDLEGELRQEFSEQFGVAEGTAFVSGNAALQPQGFLKHPDIPVVHPSGGTDGAIATDVMIKILYDLPAVYAANSTWAMQRATVGEVRKLRYGSTDQRYIWDPGITSDSPSTILGRPYIELPDMPTVATTAYSIILGDFNRGYLIVDRVQMAFKRLAERWVEDSLIGIYARKRVGGQVILPEAFRVYEIE